MSEHQRRDTATEDFDPDLDPTEQHNDLFFGAAEDDDGYHVDPDDAPPPTSRLATRRRVRQRRRRGLYAGAGAFLVLIVVAVVVLVGIPAYHYFRPQNYSGSGSGSVIVTVHANDGAAEIGATLVDDGVVGSQRAFTDAAASNARSRTIQPGSYRMREHMSATDALQLMLVPSTRIDSDVVVTEGATTFDVASRLTSPPCTASSPNGTVCGVGLSKSSVAAALKNVKALGLPTEFTVQGTPTSAEGFLYPATYPFDHGTSAESALQTMVSGFTDHARSTDFTTRAKALNLTPYQELIIASIVQSEAKYPDDMARVARVILNRLAVKMPLQVDATSIYGAEVLGLDPAKTIHAQLDSPYNTYLRSGLPPTPISNPGAAALNAAAHPATGNWIYYVNSSPDRLFFTNSEGAFEKAEATCRTHNWGCG